MAFILLEMLWPEGGPERSFYLNYNQL